MGHIFFTKFVKPFNLQYQSYTILLIKRWPLNMNVSFKSQEIENILASSILITNLAAKDLIRLKIMIIIFNGVRFFRIYLRNVSYLVFWQVQKRWYIKYQAYAHASLKDMIDICLYLFTIKIHRHIFIKIEMRERERERVRESLDCR